MKKHPFIKIASVLLALVMIIGIVPTFSAAYIERVATTQIENSPANNKVEATIDEFLCEIENGAITVTGYIGSADKFTVPSKLGGYTVTAVADNAFKGNTTLRSITFSYEIRKIGESACEGCTALNSIYINGDPIIGKNAFFNTGYYNNESNWRQGLLLTSLYKNILFAVKKDVEGIVYLPDSVTNIAACAFENCDKVTGIYIFDEAFTNIGDRAFADCDNLLGVKIPVMADYIGNEVFAGSEKAEAYCVDDNAYIESKCKKENIPVNIMGMYSTYDEEWDITLTAYDDIWFTVEEVVFSEEDKNEIYENLSGIKIGKAYKINTYNPYTSPDGAGYNNISIKAPVEGDALVEIFNSIGYKAYPYYLSSFKDGYGEFRYYTGEIVADIEFTYHSLSNKTHNVSVTLPVPYEVKTFIYKLRNEENDYNFSNDIDSYIPEGKSFVFVRVVPEQSDYLHNYPAHLGIKTTLPTNYGENVAYSYHANLGFLPIDCETKDGFVEVYIPQNIPYDIGVIIAGIEGTEITEPTTPSEPVQTTTPDEIKPTKPSTFDEPVTTDPTEDTTSTEDEPTVPDESETPTEPATPDEEDLLLGDVNRDGKLNIRDATLIQKYLAKLSALDDEQIIIADINLDKKVNIKDVTTIQKKIAKLI